MVGLLSDSSIKHTLKKLCAVMTEMKSWRLTVPLRTVLTGAGNQELSELANQNKTIVQKLGDSKKIF